MGYVIDGIVPVQYKNINRIVQERYVRAQYVNMVNSLYGNPNGNPNGIKKVIFNDPATIVFWNDGTKTVVKAHDEEFDPEKGLAMAISKKLLGNKGNYYNEFKKWLPK